MKKKNIFKFLNILFLLVSLGCGSVYAKSQPKEKPTKTKEISEKNTNKKEEDNSKEIEENIKRVDRIIEKQVQDNKKRFKDFNPEDYKFKNYSLKVYYKSEIPILTYVHEPTNALVVIIPSKTKKDLDSCTDRMFFRAPATDERGFVHFFEHIVGGGFNEIIKKLGENHSFNAQTTSIGLDLTSSSNFPSYKTYLKHVLKDLKNKDLNVDDETFDREKKRIFYELKDLEKGTKIFLDQTLQYNAFGREYKVEGNSDKVNKITKDQVRKFYKKVMHPGNSCVIKYIADLSVENVREVLKSLSEEYFDSFTYGNRDESNSDGKSNIVKVKMKDDTPFRKMKFPYDSFIFKAKKDEKNFKTYKNIAKISYWFGNSTEDHKKIASLYLSVDGNYVKDFKKELRKYVKTLGYDNVGIEGLENNLIYGMDMEFKIILFSNKGESLFEEKTLKENSGKILEFIKNKLKNMDDAKLTSILNPIVSFTDKFNSPVLTEYPFTKLYDSEALDDLILKSFSLYNEPFSTKFFNVNENNEILEFRKNYLEAAKSSFDIYDKLIKQGPTYIDHIVADENVKYFDKFKYDYFKYNIPIKIKDYKNNKALFYLASKSVSDYFTLCLGLHNNLTHAGFNEAFYYKGPISISTSCSESKNAVFGYINKNFDKIIKNYKPTKEQIEETKQNIKKKFSEKLENMEKSYKKFLKFKKDFELYLKGESHPDSKITKDLKIRDIHNLLVQELKLKNESFEYFHYAFHDSYESFVNELTKENEKEIEFFNKYVKMGDEKITKEYAKDYYDVELQRIHDHIKSNLQFYRTMVREIDSIKFEDVKNAVKSAYLLKDGELKEMEKLNELIVQKDLNELKKLKKAVS